MHLRTWLTVLCSLLLLAITALLLFSPATTGPLTQLRYPGQSAGRIIDRHMEFYEGYEDVPVWERTLHKLLFGSRAEVSREAIGVYREVLRHLTDRDKDTPSWVLLNTRARLLVTLAETGHAAAIEAELARFDPTLEEEVVIRAIRYAYADADSPVYIPEILTGAGLLPLGWAADHLRIRLAEKLGNMRLRNTIQQRLIRNGMRARQRLLILTGIVSTVIVWGLLVILGLRGRLPGSPWPPGVLAAPWGLREGYAVFVRAALLGLIVYVSLDMLEKQFFSPGILALWSTLFASIPMLWLIYHHLLRPHGRSFRSAFGLTLNGVKIGAFLNLTVALIAVEWLGTSAIALAAWKLGLDVHWSEGLSERLFFGPLETTLLTGINIVLWTAVFEEIGFRGLVYTTLRSRLRPLQAAIISAALFGSLHLYSLTGLLTIFWSGLVLAYAYERYRSLLPGMLIHGTGNLLTFSMVVLFYR